MATPCTLARLRHATGFSLFPERRTIVACKCKHCYGLREYLRDKGLDTRGLPAAQGHPTLPSRAICSGTLTCHCIECQTAKVRPVKRVKQPWEVA